MKKGTEVIINNSKVYPTYDSKSSNIIISGNYFIYDSKVRNNRIRVTDDKEKVNLPCSMTGWINLDEISKVEVDEA